MDLNAFGQYGLPGLLLGVFIWLHVRSLKGAEKREETMGAQLLANRAECRQDTDRLVKRIQDLEDRQSNDASTMLHTCADALRMNAQSFSKLTETERLPAVKVDR